MVTPMSPPAGKSGTVARGCGEKIAKQDTLGSTVETAIRNLGEGIWSAPDEFGLFRHWTEDIHDGSCRSWYY